MYKVHVYMLTLTMYMLTLTMFLQIRKSHNILQHPLLLWEMEKELQLTSQPTKDNLPVSSEIRVKFGSVIRFVLKPHSYTQCVIIYYTL